MADLGQSGARPGQYNVYGWGGPGVLGLPAARALSVAAGVLMYEDEGDPEIGWLAEAIQSLAANGTSVKVERPDGRWVRVVRAD